MFSSPEQSSGRAIGLPLASVAGVGSGVGLPKIVKVYVKVSKITYFLNLSINLNDIWYDDRNLVQNFI